MSGQWEVVGKKRDKSTKLPVAKTINSTPKKIVNKVKIDEILPKSQVQNLYNSNKSNKENKKPNEKPKNQESNAKKTQKKEKIQEPMKPKPPKSIESALNNIDLKELENVFEKSQNHFPDAPIIWLKEILQFFNQKMPIEVQDPTFSGKREGYPLNVVPVGVKGIIEKAITQAGKDNTQLFFDICLTSMASDMSKELPALGNKIFLQFIAVNEPLLISENVNKYVTLKNSYQNRSNIGLSILWAVGHVGVNNFQCGLEVFQKLYLPLIDMKSYSRYIASYLLKLLSKDNITFTKEQYLSLLDAVYSNNKNFPTDLKRDLSVKLSEIKSLLFRNKKEKYSIFFELVFKKILGNSDKSYQDCLCDILINIFHEDKTTLTSWSKIYSKNVTTSAILLKYIATNWNIMSKKITKSDLNQLLDGFKMVNAELSQKKNISGLKEATESIKIINEKMVAKKNSGSFFKLVLITAFIFTQIIFVTILHQAYKSGNLDENVIKQKLEKYGLYFAFEYYQKASEYFGKGISWVDTQLEDTYPGYRKAIADMVEPYVYLFSKTGKLIYNASQNIHECILEKYPIALQNIDYYVPGLVENSQKIVSNTYSTSAFYLNSSVDYLKQNVFTGQLAPENVQRVVLDALNSTQQKASEYYLWIYEKVQTTIK